MKKTITILICLFTLFIGVSQTLPPGNFKKHLTFKDTFFGNEENFQVCYPKEHRMFFIGIFIASAIAVTLFVIIIVIKSKHNRILSLINKEIQGKNKEIIDSITYAKRIQESILPSESRLKELSSAFSVLYKPRDIVSGDLYWVHTNNSGIYIAVIDCTGHGVPGAFLSLLAHNAIEQAVIEKNITSPKLILDSMNSFVKSVLNQHESDEVKDGMEAGVCHISNGKVSYSGANIGLKIFSDNKLRVIKPSKCSVGTVQKHVIDPPEEHVITLKKGDRIFMHSDGIVDQFGGNNNKKLTSKYLNQLLEETSSLSLKDQRNKMEILFNDWKGINEQTDDVLLTLFEI